MLFEEDKCKVSATEPTVGQIFSEIIFFDYCLREKPKSRPCFAVQSRLSKQELKETYLSFDVKREEEGMHDMEKFSFDPVKTAECGLMTGESSLVLFSYERREAMYGGALWQSAEYQQKKKNG